MGVKPAFDPNAPFEPVVGEATKPAFDPKAPFEPVDETPPAAAKPPFDPNQPHEAVSGEAAPPEAPTAMPPEGGIPLPRQRPAAAPGIVQPTQPTPPVQPLEDVPFRAKMRGKADEPGPTGEYPEAPGLTGM